MAPKANEWKCSAMEDVDNRVIEIVAEVTQVHHEWASYELILSILMDRYSISRFDELGVGTPLDIPSLKLIHDLNQRLKVFLYAYCSESFVTYLDLERDASYMLRTFAFPTMAGLIKAKSVTALDPNEIAVDEMDPHVDDIDKEIPQGIDTYGLGSLHKHPFVQELLPVPLLPRERLKDGMDVLGVLSRYLASGKKGDVEDFTAYILANAWGGACDSLAEAGVHMRSLDCTEVLACRHAVSARSRSKILEGKAVETAVGMKRAARVEAEFGAGKRRRKAEEEEEDEDEPDNETGVKITTMCKYETVPTATLKSLCSPLSHTTGKQGAAAAGRWGEALVYQYLLQTHPSARVTWVNEEEEAMSPYDIILEQDDKQGGGAHTKTKTTFVEVKSSRYPDRHAFSISLNEWAFCTAEPALRYDIYRVYSAGNPESVSISVLPDLHELVKQQRVQLLLTLT